MNYDTMRAEEKVNDDYLKAMQTLLRQAQADHSAAVAEIARLYAELKQAQINYTMAIQDY
jgi:hypothetical protein